MRKSILFIADKPEWAYHFIVKTWTEALSEDYDCYIAFGQDFYIRACNFSYIDILKNKILNYINPNRDIKYIIHPSQKYSYPLHKIPPVYNALTNEKVAKIDFDFTVEMSYYLQYVSELPFISNKKLIGLYTDCYPHEGPSYDGKKKVDLKSLDRKSFYQEYLSSYDGIIVGNTNLYEDYAPFTNKLVFANGIYKQDLFLENINVGTKQELTIGWTGTPDRPMKGFRSIIEPSIRNVQKTGRRITLKTKFSGDYKELFSFYQDVDLVLIASNADTGPSLFSEASLCGVPCISTQIGFPKMIIKHNENGLFIERNIEDMTNAIIDLYDNREKLITFAQRIKEDYLKFLDNKISISNLKLFLKTL